MPGDLERLDGSVVEIRRYCQILDFEIQKPNGEMLNLFQIYLNQIAAKEGEPLSNIPLTGGWLERVAESKDHPAREALLWDNSFFGSPDENEKAIWEYSESENSPFDLHPDVIEELDKLIFIPKWLKKSIISK